MSTDAKLLFVLNSLDVGGSETKVVRLANALANSGSQVEIAYLAAREDLLERIDSGIRTTCLHRRGKYSIGALRRLEALLGQEPTVLVAVNLYPLVYTLPATWRMKPSKAKKVALINTAQVGASARRLGRGYAPLLRRCDRLVFGCRSEMRLWLDRFALPESRSEYIYNGVDECYFSPPSDSTEGTCIRQAHHIPGDAIVIGSAGRLSPVKAFDDAIHAVARLNKQGQACYLALAGEGAERSRLEGIASQNGIRDKVKFLGMVKDVRPALSMMDIFVLPSTTETFSNAVLEAMAMETPIVLSDIGGAREMVEHGESGMLFVAGNIQNLTQTLALLCESAALRRRMGSAARQRVLQGFQFSSMLERYRSLSSL